MTYTVDPHISKRLERDLHPQLLKENTLPYLLNGDIQDHTVDRSGTFVQNMRGNRLLKDLGQSLRGIIQLDKGELIAISAPGKIELIKGKSCRTIIDAPCLDITNEITGRYQYVNGERHIYWIEKDGPIRVLNLSCPPKLRLNECSDCPAEFSNEIDCDQLLYNPKVDIPCLSLDYDSTGNLPNGNYQVAVAFYDDNQRITEYYIMPDIVRPFSENGGHSINVTFSGCPSPYFDQYELVLIAHRSDRGTQAQSIGLFSTSQLNIGISTLDEARYEPVDLSVLLSTDVRYQSADFIANNNETLVLAGVQERKRLNGQQVANTINLKWYTLAVRKEEAHKYPSFNRWETYAFDISWVFCDGEESRRFHIPNNVAKPTEPLPVDENYFEINECDRPIINYWEVYDTSTLDFYNPIDAECKEPKIVAQGDFSYWESSSNKYPEGFPDYECENIRYHRFPKHMKHGEATALTTNNPCGDVFVHVMGVLVPKIGIPTYCDGRESKDIVGYKIYVRDRVGQESVLSSGLLYNVRSYNVAGEEVMFQNYPFNDLNPDEFLLEDKRNQGNVFDPNDRLNNFYDDRFTYYSPDLQFVKGARGTEIQVMFEAIGGIKGEYHETEGMPRYQVLSPLGRLAAQTAGILEARAVLNGEPCTTTVVEEECIKRVDRTTDVSNFPIPDVSQNTYTLTNGTAQVPQIRTDVRTEDYSYTTQGDPDCTVGYQLTSVEVVDFFDPLIPGIDDQTDTCLFKVNTNAPGGTVLTVTLNNTEYNITLNDDGEGSIQLNGDCEPFGVNIPLQNTWTITNTPHHFSPECDCPGDTITRTRTESQTCETKIKLLGELPSGERLPAMMYYYSQGREAVGSFLQSLIGPKNYAIQYTASTCYSGWAQSPVIRRGVDFQQFLTSNKVFINEQRFNNQFQASADYIETSSVIPRPQNIDLSRVLSPSVDCAPSFCCISIDNQPVQAVSYYTQLRRRLPDQYGNLTNGRVRAISCVLPNQTTNYLLGGDVYVTKHRFVRKFQLFSKLPLNLPDNTEFDLSLYPHIGFPRFWMDNNKESALEDILEDLPLVNVFFQDYNLDSVAEIGQCFGSLEQQDWLNLFGGIGYLSQWFTSLVADGWTNPFRLSGKYYTHVTGVVEYWGESKFIADNREKNELKETQYRDLSPEFIADARRYENPEVFLYNLQYLWGGLTKQTLHSQNQKCCDRSGDYRLVYSLQQRSSDRSDRWRNLLPNNFAPLPTHTGNLVTMQEIGQYNLFLGFEDGAWVTQQEDGLLTNDLNQVYLGTAGAFSRRLRRLTDEDSGYGGIQNPKAFVNTRYGAYWIDAKRKKFLMYNGQLNDLTSGLQSWMNKWLTENIVLGYDNLSDNVYVTMDESKGFIHKPRTGHTSFLSWSVDDFFTMPNTIYSLKDNQLWEHNVGEYQSFFGQLEPFEVGLTFKRQMRDSMLQSVDIYAEFTKEVGCDTVYLDEFFEECMAFNQKYTTLWQDITLQNSNNIIPDITTDNVVVSIVEDFVYRFNRLNIRSNDQPIIRHQDGIRYTQGVQNVNEEQPIQGRHNELRLRKTSTSKVRLELGVTMNHEQTNP